MTGVQDDDPEVLRIISAALEMREEGIEPPVSELCGDREDLIPAVAAALGVAGRLPELQRASAGGDDLVERVFSGRYRLISRIGAGSMGVVYHAEDLELRRPVALKILRSETWGGEEAVARFAREAEALAAVRHASIVSIYDRGETEDGVMFLVMELLEGVSLSELLELAGERAKQSGGSADGVSGTEWIQTVLGAADTLDDSYLRQAVRWVEELARALQVAHESGVAHRDVKPSNIFVRSDGSPVLLDFGIAARSSEATLALRDGALGTPAYMAPELVVGGDEDRSGDGRHGVAVDVYELTATLYHLLTLRPPYLGSPPRVLTLLARRDPTLAAQLRPGLPRDLQAVLDKGMMRDPAQRYASAAALADDLRAVLQFRPVSARRVTGLQRLWRRVCRSRELRAVAAVLCVAGLTVAAVYGFAAWRESRHEGWKDAWVRVPPTVVTTPKQMRDVVDPEHALVIMACFDAVALDEEYALPGRLLRAAFRLDRGDPSGAARDFEVIAEIVGSEYASALAERYADLPTTARGAAELRLAELPEPRGATDRYLAAFHLIRNPDVDGDRRGAYEQARAYLADPELQDAEHHAAAELRFQLDVEFFGRDREARIAASRRLYDSVLLLEQAFGRRTAGTSMALGAALLGQSRSAEAVAVLREGVDLAPMDASLRLNLGTALRLEGALEPAREQFEAAARLRPQSRSAYQSLVLTLVDLGDFDAARTAVARAGFGDDPSSQRARSFLLGKVEFGRALERAREGDEAGMVAIALTAVEHFEAARNPASGRPDRAELVLSRALAATDSDSVFDGMQQLLARSPLAWQRIKNFASLLPSSLNEEQTEGLRRYLLNLSSQLAPESDR